MSVLDELRVWFDKRTLTAGVRDSVTVEAGTLAALLDIAVAVEAHRPWCSDDACPMCDALARLHAVERAA